MKFNDIEMPSWFRIIDIYGRGIASRNLDLVTVPGMHGAHLNEVITPPKYLEIKVRIDAKDKLELSERIDEINAILDVQEPVPIVFPDEPNWTYYGIPEIASDEGRKTFFARDTITIVCPDPYKYGPEKTVIFPSDVVAYDYKGSAEAFPVYEMTVTAPITFAMIQNHLEESMLIGKPAEIDSQIVNEKELIFNEFGESIDDWQSQPGFNGSFVRGSQGIQVSNWGSGSEWHGAGAMKEIDPIQDFEIEMYIYVRTEQPNQSFRISTNFYDENNNEIGLLRLWDKSAKRVQKVAEARVGPFVDQYHNYLISDRNYNVEGQRVWGGILRVTRKGNQFKFYVARISQTGKHIETITETFNDVNNDYMGRLKFIRIDIANYGTTEKPNEIGINSIRVYRHNSLEVDQTPYIAYPGDIITFDTQTEEILINGEDAMTEKAFITDFFTLKKGENTLAVLPEDSLNVKMRYRERRK